jgi:hypothetical protein
VAGWAKNEAQRARDAWWRGDRYSGRVGRHAMPVGGKSLTGDVLRLAAGRLTGLALLAAPAPAVGWTPGALFAPCTGDCSVAIYAGIYVENSMSELLSSSPQTPFTWEYGSDDHLVATAVSREVAQFWNHWTLEPEVGIGQRFGRQSATELWGAFFFRYHGFPWDKQILTTAALSTGLNWASEVTYVEEERAQDGTGSQWMHFFAPEITFAHPSRPNVELLLRFHHRSGVFGLVSDAWGGAQYATVGVRVRF